MSQTETYTNLLATIEALHGATFIDIEKTRIRHLVNSRARAAYRESDLWDQFLVVGEERVVNDSDPTQLFVPFIGTTSASADVTSIQSGDIDTVLRAHDANPFAVNSPREYEVLMGENGVILPGYKVTYGGTTGATALTGSNPNFTWLTSSKQDGIVGGTISVDGIVTSNGVATDALINSTHTITNVSYLTDSQTYISFSLATSIGSANISNVEIKFPVVYLTYKKRLDVTYGDQDGDSTTLPMEWRDYISLGVFADTLASDGFVEKSFAMESRANKALQRELERLDRNRGNQFVNHRVRTHGSAQARQSA